MPFEIPKFATATSIEQTEHRATGTRRYDNVEYSIIPGFRPLLLDLTIPESPSGPVPVVIYIHGGGWLFGSNKATNPIVPDKPSWKSLLQAGIAVASVQYRLSGEANFPAALQDVSAAVRWIRHFGPDLGLDPDRIAAWGGSAGGHLAALLAMNIQDANVLGELGVTGTSSKILAAVAWYPPTDLLRMAASQAVTSGIEPTKDSAESRLIGAEVQTHPGLARAASPITYAGKQAAPLLLVHGAEDRVVPPEQSEVMRTALQRLGARVELVIAPGADHSLIGVDRTPYIERSTAFLAAEFGRESDA